MISESGNYIFTKINMVKLLTFVFENVYFKYHFLSVALVNIRDSSLLLIKCYMIHFKMTTFSGQFELTLYSLLAAVATHRLLGTPILLYSASRLMKFHDSCLFSLLTLGLKDRQYSSLYFSKKEGRRVKYTMQQDINIFF